MFRSTLLFPLLALTLVSCSGEYKVEDELYACIEQEFVDHGLNLEDELDTLEILFLNAGLIKSASPDDYRDYYQENINQGMVRVLENTYTLERFADIKLSFHELETCVLKKLDGGTYDESKFAQISDMIDTTVRSTGQMSSSAVAEAHLHFLTADDFEHPFYRANILLSLQGLYFRKYVTDVEYLRPIPKKIE